MNKNYCFKCAKLLYIMLLMLGISVSSSAATIGIGASGTGTTNLFPITSCYGYTYSQQIILASEYSASGGAGNITSVRFYLSSVPATFTNSDSWVVTIGHTAKTEFTSNTDWVPAASLTQVFNGTITAVASTWVDVVFTTPFNYNGTDNIVVAIDENVASWNCTANWSSYVTPEGDSRGIYYRNDSNNPDPAAPPTATGITSTIAQIQFEGVATACPAPAALSSNVLSSAEADLDWTTGGATDWVVEYGLTGFAQGTGTVVPVTGTDSLNLTSLTPATAYDWYVRDYCNPDSSVWMGPNSFTTLVTCPAPTVPTYQGISSDTVAVSWITGGASQWVIEYDTANYTQGTGTSVLTSDNPYTFTGLTPATDYWFYIRDYCGPADSSVWIGPYLFTTNPIAPATAMGVTCTTPGATSTIMFSEDFEDNSAGWTGDVGTSNGDWEIPDGSSSTPTGPTDGYLGGNFMNFEASNTNTNQGSIVSPAINLTAGLDDAELSFWMHAFGASMGTLEVGVGTTATGPFTTEFTWTGQYQSYGAQPWINVGVDLSAYVGQTIYIQFTQIDDNNVAGNGYDGDMSIDLFEISACVTCPFPIVDSTSFITETTADLFWTTGGSSQWDVEYGQSGFTLGTGTLLNVTGSSDTTLTGLTSGTNYEWYTRGLCTLDSSGWVGPISFSTMIENDEISGAIELTLGVGVCSSPLVGTNLGATNSGVAHSCASYNGGDVWYYAIVPADSSFSVEGTNIDWTDGGMQAYAGPSNALVSINCDDDDSPAGNMPGIYPADGLVSLIPGDTVWIAIWEYGNNAFGQFEICAWGPPTCFVPTSISSDVISPNEVNLEWTTGGASDWIVQYGLNGFTLGNGIDSLVSGIDSLNLGSLDVNTNYDWYVRDYCGVADSSVWAGPFSFTTFNANDAGVVANLESGSCGTMNADVQVEVENFGINDLYNMDVTVHLSGAVANSFTITIDTLIANSSLNVVLGSVNTLGGGTIDFEAYTSLLLDNNNLNDTLFYSIDYDVLPVVPILAAQTVCENELVEFNTHMTTRWYETGTNNIILDDSVISFTAVTDTMYDYAVYGVTDIQVGNTVAPTSSFITTSDWGVIFNTSNDIVINTMVVYPTGTGTIDVSVMDNATETIISTVTGITVSDGGIPLSAATVSLGVSVPANINNYRLVLTAYNGITSLGRGSGQPGPFGPVNGVTVLGGSTGSSSVSSSYYWFYDWNVSVPGCESLRETVSLNVTMPSFSMQNETICQGNTLTLPGGTLVSNAGSYDEVFVNAVGCDSTVTTTVVINVATASSEDVHLCDGDTYTLPLSGLVVSTANAYLETSMNSVGCDSVITYNVTTGMSSASAVALSFCTGGDVTLADGTVVTMAGTYSSTTTNATGCDDLVTYTVTENMTSMSTMTETICENESFMFDGQALTMAGVYTMMETAANGCDSTVELTLTVNATSATPMTAAICAGDSYMFNGTALTMAGTYTQTEMNAAGCDSVITLMLTVNATSASSMTAEICDGDSYMFDGNALTMAGSYSQTMMNAAGCDSIISLTLTVNVPTNETMTAEICKGSEYSFGTQTLTDAGVYTEIFTNTSGCEYEMTLTLVVNNNMSTSEDVLLCGDQLEFTLANGTVVTEAGIYTALVPADNGCDNIITYSVSTCVGIFDLDNNVAMTVYPNPAKDVLNVVFAEQLTTVNNITVVNVLGQDVYSTNNVDETTVTINTSSLTSGIYYLHVTSDNKVSVKSFTIAK